jgi:dynein heavy chain
VQENARAGKALRECEDKILSGLKGAKDINEILETDDLINVLDESRATSDDIKIRMAESAKAEVEIDKTRETFRPVAFRASILFFTIVELSAINDMYQYSLQWFAGLFGASVDNSAKAPNDSAKRIENLNNHFTLSLYENVCRSLFEVNKLMFSLILCARILFGDKALDPTEWRFFLAGPTGSIEPRENPTDWFDDLAWGSLWS